MVAVAAAVAVETKNPAHGRVVSLAAGYGFQRAAQWCGRFCLVDRQGVEPRCPSGRQIYSLLRSPMPPAILGPGPFTRASRLTPPNRTDPWGDYATLRFRPAGLIRRRSGSAWAPTCRAMVPWALLGHLQVYARGSSPRCSGIVPARRRLDGPWPCTRVVVWACTSTGRDAPACESGSCLCGRLAITIRAGPFTRPSLAALLHKKQRNTALSPSDQRAA